MKTVILISENLLLGSEIPSDLLDPNRFDLRSVQYASEIIPLSAALRPRVIILDLDHPELESTDLGGFLKKLHEPALKADEPLVCLLGILKKEKREKANQYFESGINALLYRPFQLEHLQEEIQHLLGTKFRRLERKEFVTPVTLSSGEKKWIAKTQNINLEYLTVEGENLPPLGLNVRIQGEHPCLSHFDLWAYCWKKNEQNENGIIFRFLNPEIGFLEGIQKLPKEASDLPNANDELLSPPNAPASVLIPSTLENPALMAEIDAAILLPHLRKWLEGQAVSPAVLGKTLANLSDFERNSILSTEPQGAKLAEIYTFKIFIKAQLDGLLTSGLTGMENNPKETAKILSSHEEKIGEASKHLQAEITDAAIGDNSQLFEALNLLKSDSQKTLVSMRQTIDVQGRISGLKQVEKKGLGIPSSVPSFATPGASESDDYAPTRYKERPPPPSRLKKKKKKNLAQNFAQQALTFGFFIVLLFALGLIFHFQWTSQKRKLSLLTPEEVKMLSPYFSEALLYDGKEDVTLSIKLTSDWNTLKGENLLQEAQNIAAKLEVKDITIAELITTSGAPAASYINGQIQLLGLTQELAQMEPDGFGPPDPRAR